MALMRLPRSLISTQSCRPPSTAELQYRTLQSQLSDTYTKCSKIRFRKAPWKMVAQQTLFLKYGPHQCSHHVRNLIGESRNGISIQSLPTSRCTTPTAHFGISSYRPAVNGVSLISSHCGPFLKRSFSINPISKSAGPSKSSESVFAKDGKGYRNASNNHRKAVKASANQGTSGAALQNIFSGTEKSSEILADGKKKKGSPSGSVSCAGNNEQHLSAEGKPKRRSRRKKKEEPSDASPSADASSTKSSKGVSGSISQETNINGKLSKMVESGSIGDACKEVADVSASTKTRSRSRRTKKMLKEARAVEKTNGVLVKPQGDANQVLSCSESSQKSKLQTVCKPTPNGDRKLKPLYPPTGKSVVVVESLTKAKVIQGYLGDRYEVLPSYGHVRDLAARSGSVRPDDDFSMVWEVPAPAWTHLKSIKVAISGADNLILASDPDREGEAIAWHIIEMLQQQDSLAKDVTVARVVFQEITESAIKSALQSPRNIDVNLVHAYLARRALDYLIGFNISPLLWRKLPGCQSAGRVQSAALSLICDREMEIDEFKPQEYWTVGAAFKIMTQKVTSSVDNYPFSSYLTHFNSKKLNQLSIGSNEDANNIKQQVSSSHFKVSGSKRTKINRNPPTPYITSTLQQDAANKLNFTAAYTMKLAQKLYEGTQLTDGKAVGLITYMRTDGLHLSDDAVNDIRSLITERYGQRYVSETPRKFFKKVKNAQEAHEAIRPTDIRRLPSMLAGALDEDSLKLYTLVWSRTMSCQMEPAKVDQIQLDIGNDSGSITFRAACSTVGFLGYRAVYEDLEAQIIRGNENEVNDHDEFFKILTNLKTGDPLWLENVELKHHHTQPSPRYSEASLVKKLEELGIGRPSTYATTLKVLHDRKYVTVKSRVLYPEFRGRMVSAFLSHYFTEVTDYSFTADMEAELDNVSAGLTEWKGLLRDYWSRFSSYCEKVSKVHIHQVEKMLERTFENFLFSSLPDESRTCPSCLEGTLIFKVSRFGAGYFIGCDQHPKCKYIAKTLYGEEEEDDTPQENNNVEEPKLLGVHPVSNEKVFLKNGPYGFYLQLGEDRKGYLPKRASVSQIKDVDSITLEDALEWLRFPITLGDHPEDHQPVIIKIAKVGFTIRHRRNIAPVPKNLKPQDITMEKALELLKSKDVRRCGRPKGKPRAEQDLIEAF